MHIYSLINDIYISTLHYRKVYKLKFLELANNEKQNFKKIYFKIVTLGHEDCHICPIYFWPFRQSFFVWLRRKFRLCYKIKEAIGQVKSSPYNEAERPE